MAISTHDEAHESTDLDLKQGLMTKAVSTTIMRSSTQLFCPLASPAACVTHLLSNNKHVEMTDADHVPGCLILQHHTNRSSPAPSPQPYRVSLLCYFPFFFFFLPFFSHFALSALAFSTRTTKPPIFFFFRTTLFSCCFRYF